MKSFLDLFLMSLAVGLISTSGGLSLQVSGQEDEQIEIVDQDGQKLSAHSFKFITRQDGEPAQADGRADIRTADGKIIIIDKDGKQREIDVSGAQNIIVNKSVQSIIKDGDVQRKVIGKAIITSPDGEQHEITLGGDGQDLFLPHSGGVGIESIFEMMPGKGQDFGPRNFVFGSFGNIGKYMIGVNCSDVSDQLRAHLDLADDVGLVVTSVSNEDSPAAAAGIKMHDILIYADQKELGSTQDLIDAIQLAGEENREVTITLLRSGKEMGVDVKPTERATAGIRIFNGLPANEFKFEKVGPGFVFDAEVNNEIDIEQLMQQAHDRMDEMKQQIDDMKGIHELIVEESLKRAKNKEKDN